MIRRMKKRFLDWPLAQKFVFVFSLMTLLSGALMVGALHLGLSVPEEKFYEKSLQELDFFLQRVDGDIQEVDTLTAASRWTRPFSSSWGSWLSPTRRRPPIITC